MGAKRSEVNRYKQVPMWLSYVSGGGTAHEARQLVTNNRCCQISASPMTNLSNLCHLSHKTASKPHLLNLQQLLSWSLAMKFLVIIHHSVFVSRSSHTPKLSRVERKKHITSPQWHFRHFQMLCAQLSPSCECGPNTELRASRHTHTHNSCTHQWDRNVLGMVSRAWQGNTQQPCSRERTDGSRAESGAQPRYVSWIRCQEMSPNSSPRCKNTHGKYARTVQWPGNTLRIHTLASTQKCDALTPSTCNRGVCPGWSKPRQFSQGLLVPNY